MTISNQLLEKLTQLGPQMAGLKAALDCDGEQAFVYYLCPLSNLRRIAESGILPNASAPQDRTDLSGQGVQARREVDVLLTNGLSLGAHLCVNLFWNPINLTARAFQRNGVIAAASSGNADDAVLCILEVDLQGVLNIEGCAWTIAPQNLAGSGFTNFSPDYFIGAATWPDGSAKCDWQTIFEAGDFCDRRTNAKRSAELIVHLPLSAGGDASSAVSFDLVNRIILADDSVTPITPDQLAFLQATGKPISRSGTLYETLFLTREELLKSEIEFSKSLRFRGYRDPRVLQKLNSAVDAVRAFEREHPQLSPRRSQFTETNLADGHHGSLHAVRVMLWAAFIAQHYDDSRRSTLMPVLLTAAALHDIRRADDSDNDQDHGRLAVEAYGAAIADIMPDEASATACRTAIAFHCIEDSDCPDELALKVLKDADALDRGRFGPPDSASGCNTAFFRTDLLRNEDSYKNIAWMAFRAAQITRFTPFGANPCCDFLCLAANVVR